MAKILIITAKRNGYRRCGIAHPDHAVEYPAARFTPEQIQTLKTDSGLIVQEADDKSATDDSGKNGKGGK